MQRARLIGAVAGAMVLMGAAAVAGCGDGGVSATAAAALSAREVRRCMFEGGAHPGDQIPTEPAGLPSAAESVMITGPNQDHVAIYVSRQPVLTPNVARGFEELGELHPEILLEGRALILFLLGGLSKETEELALSCVEGRGVPASAPSAMSTIPNASQFRQCMYEGGGKSWGQVPTLPKGFPSDLETVRNVGPKRGHVTIYIAARPVFDQRIVKGISEFGEYQAKVLYGGRGLLLLDWDIAKKDEELASECVEA